MPKEIERKYLVADPTWRHGADAGQAIVQAYLAHSNKAVVRVRIVAGTDAFITVKSSAPGQTRDEFEYSVPVADANALISLCEGVVLAKTRYRVPHAGHIWEVDVYSGENAGLVIAEVELESEATAVDLPAWIGAEVTEDPRYYAARLSQHPFAGWAEPAAQYRGRR